MTLNQPTLGVTLAIIGSVMTSVSYILMKIGALRYERSLNANDKSREQVGMTNVIIFNWQYISGFLLLLGSLIINSVAINYASIILISTTSCVTIIFNAILTPFLLHERFNWRVDGLMIAFLLTGTTLCCLQSPDDDLVERNTFKSMSFEDVAQYQQQKVLSFQSVLFYSVMMVIHIDTRKR